MSEPVRPDVLAYPSPTSVRFVVLVVATLSAGLFAGAWVHNIVAGDEWHRAVAACVPGEPPPGGDAGVLRQHAAFEACTAPAERRRALYSLGGLAVGGLGALLALYVSPLVVQRRRRLRPIDPKFAAASERFDDLSRDVGLRRPPELMVGTPKQRDAFCYGVPGRYRVVLPLGMVIRPGSPAFAALAAHELAHVARRDVTVAWLARSVGYAVAPVLLLPVVLAAAAGDFSVVPDYSWRALVLGAVVVVTRAAILRSREYDADLRAARYGSDVPAVSALVGSIRQPARSRLRELVANHPGPASRVAVLHRPDAVARVGFVDGLTAAFLAALVPPLVELAVVPLLTDTGHVGLTDVVASAIAGPLVGGTVGLALWRASLVRRVTGAPVRLAPVTAGVFAGIVLGGAASLAQSATSPLDRDDSPLFLVLTAICAAGATVTVAGLGELWADAAGRLRTARASWVAAVVLPGLLFAAVLWAATTTQKALQWSGWALVRLLLPEYFSTAAMIGASLVLAAAAGWALWAARRPAITPAWLVEHGPRPQWPGTGSPGPWSALAAGAAAGVAGGAVLVTFRTLAGAAPTDAVAIQRFYLAVFVAAAAGVSAALALAVLSPGRGAGAALLAVPVGCTVTATCFLAMNTALGGDLAPGFVAEVVRKPVGLALLGQMLAVSVVLLPPVARHRPGPLMPAAALGVALLAATAVVGARDMLSPADAPQPPAVTAPQPGERDVYRDEVAPRILQRFTVITAEVDRIDADAALTPSSRAAAVRQRVVTPLRELYADTEALTVTTTEVRSAHTHCLNGLRASISAYESWAVAYETGDPRAQVRAQGHQSEAVAELRAWAALVRTW